MCVLIVKYFPFAHGHLCLASPPTLRRKLPCFFHEGEFVEIDDEFVFFRLYRSGVCIFTGS